jgi:hypothetical protein
MLKTVRDIIIAALISKRYLIFSSVSVNSAFGAAKSGVSWNFTVLTSTKSGVSWNPA